MPESIPDAAEWVHQKLLNATSEAKILMVKLCGVRHQEKMCAFIATSMHALKAMLDLRATP